MAGSLPSLAALWTCTAYALLSRATITQGEVIGVTAGNQIDRDALLSLKSSCTHFGRAQLQLWTAEGYPCRPHKDRPCDAPELGANQTDWPHVSCNANNRVVGINLFDMGMECTLPDRLSVANVLGTIDLSSNRIVGTLPEAWAGRNKFPRLRTLNLAHNKLTGKLPNWDRPGAWRCLKTLDLGSNDLYGGLPASWLTKNRPLRRLQHLNLGSNRLGRDADRNLLSMAQWCQSEAGAKLPEGSGWCPKGTPISGTLVSLRELLLEENSLQGELPPKWPAMMPRVEMLSLAYNSLSKVSNRQPVPALLPEAWTSPQAGFSRLARLVLYPGNQYFCSVPDAFADFQAVGQKAGFYVQDANGDPTDAQSPMLCPVEEESRSVAPFGVEFSPKQISWEYPPPTREQHVWGFRVALSGWDSEGEEWQPVTSWAALRLKTYTLGDDGFTDAEVAQQGLQCTGNGTCTLTFADSKTRKLPELAELAGEFSRWKVDVSMVSLDGVESPVASQELTISS